MTRREMREHCFKILFGLDFFSSEETAEQVAWYFESPIEDDMTTDGETEVLHKVEMSEENRVFLTDRVAGIASKIGELDEMIDQVAKGWKTSRMGKVELTILRQALYEMRYDPEVPEKVAINEAVELAKKFGGQDSPAFINGVLAKLVTE